MDVRCPQCQTLYEIDDDRVKSNDATLKCRECQHLFRLGVGRVPSREDAQRWMVRESRGGDILYFDEFDTLHGWIMEREVDRTWEISRTGDSWKKLGEVGEFETIFQAVASGSGVHPEKDGGGGGESDSSAGPRAARPEEAESESRPRASTQSQFDRGESSRRPPAEPAGAGAGPDEVTQPDAEAAAGESSPTPGDGGDAESEAQKDVQLESGRFAGASDDASATEGQRDEGDDDAWRFEGETGREAEPEGARFETDDPVEAFDDDLEFEQGRRWPYVLVLLVVAGVGGYAWYAQPSWLVETVRKYVTTDQQPSSAPSPASVDSGDASVDAESDVAEPVAPLRASVREALAAGRTAVDEAVADRVKPAIEKARALRGSGVQRAKDVADRQADRRQQSPSGGGVAGVLSQARDALQNGDAASARETFQTAVDQAPGNPEALSGLGWALVELGRSEAAISRFKEARQADSSHGDAYMGMARAQRNLGRYREALETYQSYLDAFPNGSKASIAEYQSEQLRKQLGMD